MNMKSPVALLCGVVSMCVVQGVPARVIELKGNGITVTIDDTKGDYTITREIPEQRWSGSIGGELNRVMQGQGQDELGKFESMSFDDAGIERQIHVYVDQPIVLFNWNSDKAL